MGAQGKRDDGGYGECEFDMKTSLVTGISGQDGGHLAMQLLRSGRSVVGLDLNRPRSNGDLGVQFSRVDITDKNSISDLIRNVCPDEIYHLAAHTFVGNSWNKVDSVLETNLGGVVNILEACRRHAPECRIYNASSSEMYGNSDHCPQNELTPLVPVSPYGVSKVAAHNMCRVYRESYGMFVSCGIGFNHESETRPEIFVTRKITKAAARIARAVKDGKAFSPVSLGNLSASRDWSHARDVSRAMIMILEADEPDDFVIASGESHTVEEFCTLAFEAAGLSLSWHGRELDRVGLISHSQIAVEVSEEFFRPNDLVSLWGDPTKIKTKLGWNPKVSFKNLVSGMVNWDLAEVGLGI